MANLNQVMCTGNLLGDSRLNQTSKGDPVLNWSMAISDRRRLGDKGAWQEHSTYVECAMFGERVRYLSTKLKAGTKICVKGKLRSQEVEREDQHRKHDVSIFVEEVDFL